MAINMGGCSNCQCERARCLLSEPSCPGTSDVVGKSFTSRKPSWRLKVRTKMSDFRMTDSLWMGLNYKGTKGNEGFEWEEEDGVLGHEKARKDTKRRDRVSCFWGCDSHPLRSRNEGNEGLDAWGDGFSGVEDELPRMEERGRVRGF